MLFNLFKKLFAIALLFETVIHFSSCSYQIFYPQRLTVYSFDSVNENKVITRPYMQIVGGQLGIAHSFSKHFFIALNGQLNSSVFPLTKGTNNYSATTFSFAPNFGAGYYHFNKNENGFEIVPQFSYERNNLFFHFYSTNNYQTEPDILTKRINYLIPGIQFSYYHIPENRTNLYFTCRFSYMYADELKNGLYLSDTIKQTIYYGQNILLEPGFQFRLRELPNVRFECAAFIGLKKTTLKSYYSPLMISLRINPAIFLKGLHANDENIE